jgi:hypothetical protein
MRRAVSGVHPRKAWRCGRIVGDVPLTPPSPLLVKPFLYYLRLLMNSDAEEGNGGICFGDSGSPKLIHQTNTAVALATGGDAVCRAENYSQRLDIADARAFLGQYLELP